jgi:uncharacterized DUF497 family protein
MVPAVDRGLTFEWDEAKAISNVAKHGLPFTDAIAVFLDPERVDFGVSRPEEGETRRKVVGRLEIGLVSIVYTPRGEAIRIISARRANASEERRHGDG